MSSVGSKQQPLVHRISVNQTRELVSVATNKGFSVYSVSVDGAVQEKLRRGRPLCQNVTAVDFLVPEDEAPNPSFSKGSLETENSQATPQACGFEFVELLGRSNFMALIGSGTSPRFSRNKVVIWDDSMSKPVVELEFTSPVLNVAIVKTRIVVALKNKVYIYSFGKEPEVLCVYDVNRISGSLNDAQTPLALMQFGEVSLCAFPGRTRGTVQIVNLENLSRDSTLFTAHTSDVVALAFDLKGTLLATASEKGTVIRVFSIVYKQSTIQSMQMLLEFRRGSEHATIYHLAFSPSGKYLAVSSETGTIHVFLLPARTDPQARAERNGVLGGYLPKYLRSVWSFAQTKVKRKTKNVILFGDEQSFTVMQYDGTATHFVINTERGGDCVKRSEKQFVSLKEAVEDSNDCPFSFPDSRQKPPNGVESQH